MRAIPNPFPFSDDNKRYHTFAYHLRHRFGRRVFKLPLDGGFTCPNRDGSKGVGGCAFCAGGGTGRFLGERGLSLPEQYRAGLARLWQKHPGCGVIPYLQAGTNTYAPLPVLRERFEPLLAQPEVVGLFLATRADCLPEPVLDYLGELNRRTWLVVELGLQTACDATAAALNRGHSYARFLAGYRALQARGIACCIHLINGLPGEGRAAMLRTARLVAALRPAQVKLHMLHIVAGSSLAVHWQRDPFPLLSQAEYVSLVCDQLELLPAETVLQRLTGDGDPQTLLAPGWSRGKRGVLAAIDRELARRDSWQSRRFIPTVALPAKRAIEP